MIRHGENGFEAEAQKALDDIRKLSERSGCTMTDMAVGWVISNEAVTSSLMGARNVKQLSELTKPAEKALPADIIRELNSITADL